jgi:hypothetical protein
LLKLEALGVAINLEANGLSSPLQQIHSLLITQKFLYMIKVYNIL